jgi:type III restriction enzyme
VVERDVVERAHPVASKVPPERSFHLDTYAFDSNPEQELFWKLLNDKKIKHVYFTGMLTHGQSEFFVQYIDPDSHTVRTYYPDFIFQKEDGTWVIVEVKGEHQIDDPVVKAKQEFAEQMATASRMTYRIIGGKAVGSGYGGLFD